MVTKEKMISDNVGRNVEGELTFGGVEVSSLAKKYGTPLYLYDEESGVQNSAYRLPSKRF